VGKIGRRGPGAQADVFEDIQDEIVRWIGALPRGA
jgi:hypothetical protein